MSNRFPAKSSSLKTGWASCRGLFAASNIWRCVCDVHCFFFQRYTPRKTNEWQWTYVQPWMKMYLLLKMVKKSLAILMWWLPWCFHGKDTHRLNMKQGLYIIWPLVFFNLCVFQVIQLAKCEPFSQKGSLKKLKRWQKPAKRVTSFLSRVVWNVHRCCEIFWFFFMFSPRFFVEYTLGCGNSNIQTEFSSLPGNFLDLTWVETTC